MKKEEKNINKKGKNTDFLGMWKNFFKAKPRELEQKEEIENSKEEQKIKDELEKSLARAEKIKESIFRESIRATASNNLEVNEYKAPKVQLKEKDKQERKKQEKGEIENEREI